MQRNILCVALFALLAAPGLLAQTTPAATDIPVPSPPQHKGNVVTYGKPRRGPAVPPFSHIAIGGGVSAMGINLQAAINANRHLNLRGTGNWFNYTDNNLSVKGFNVQAKMNFATAGASLDYYPFPTHGLRLSPGVLFYNQNQITASGAGTGGSSITLNSQKYYSETANPLTMNGSLGLNTYQQAATATIGWGNTIPRSGGHWSFPFELGAAFTGVPTINVALSGFACTNQADAATSGLSCVNMATDTTAQTNLTAQVNKWKSDLNPFQVYPILSFGVAFSFRIR